MTRHDLARRIREDVSRFGARAFDNIELPTDFEHRPDFADHVRAIAPRIMAAGGRRGFIEGHQLLRALDDVD